MGKILIAFCALGVMSSQAMGAADPYAVTFDGGDAKAAVDGFSSRTGGYNSQAQGAINAGIGVDTTQSSATGKITGDGGISGQSGTGAIFQGQRQANTAGESLAATQAALTACTNDYNTTMKTLESALKAAKAAADACNEAKSKADSDGDSSTEGPDCTGPNEAVADIKTQIESLTTAFNSECRDPLNSKIAELRQAQKEANTWASDSSGTHKDSTDTKPDPKTPDVTAENFNCKTEASAPEKSICDAHFLAVCPPTMGEGQCQAFSNRYCGLPSAAASSPGFGSIYCKQATTYNFCVSGTNNSCLSCAGFSATAPIVLPALTKDNVNSNYAVCSNDPIYQDPAILALVDGQGGPVITGGTSIVTQTVVNPDLPAARLPANDTNFAFQSLAGKPDIGVESGASVFQIADSAYNSYESKSNK